MLQPNDHNQFNNLNNNRDLGKKQANKTKLPKSFIMPTQQPTYQATTQTIPLPLDKPCQVYPRVSTPEQMENVSAEMQKDKSFARFLVQLH